MSALSDALSSNAILHAVLLSASSAAVGYAVVLMHKGAAWVATKIKNDQMRATWSMASDYAERVVRDVTNSYVAPLKADGKWDAATASKAKDMATQQLQAMLQAQASAGNIVLPATTPQSTLQDVAGTFIESAVHDLQAQAAGAIDKAVPGAAPVVNLVQQGLGALEHQGIGQLEDAIGQGLGKHLPGLASALAGASAAPLGAPAASSGPHAAATKPAPPAAAGPSPHAPNTPQVPPPVRPT